MNYSRPKLLSPVCIYRDVTTARPCNKVGHLFWFTILAQDETNDVILYIRSVHKHRGNYFQRQNYKMRLKQRTLNWINSMQVKKILLTNVFFSWSLCLLNMFPSMVFPKHFLSFRFVEKNNQTLSNAGADPGGGHTRRPSPPPLKLEKIWFFWRKIMIFHTKYPKHFRASLRNWKKHDFLA